jgi:hypothetical protein
VSLQVFEDDGAVWYGPPLCEPCARRREGSPDVAFWGLRGTIDELALSGYAIAADISLRFWTSKVDLDEGDLVAVGVATDPDDEAVIVLDADGLTTGGTLYEVRAEPMQVNDGRESVAGLSSRPT